jgi:hypothetical protein
LAGDCGAAFSPQIELAPLHINFTQLSKKIPGWQVKKIFINTNFLRQSSLLDY